MRHKPQRKCRKWHLFNMRKDWNWLEKKLLDNQYWNIMVGKLFIFQTNSSIKSKWVGKDFKKNLKRQFDKKWLCE